MALKKPTEVGMFQHAAARRRLTNLWWQRGHHMAFQHAAARRRLIKKLPEIIRQIVVSTRSRPKAAEKERRRFCIPSTVSTRSRPKAAEASSETLATRGFYSPKSPKSPKKVQNEYSTAFSRHTSLANFLIVKEPSRFANLPAF